MRTGPMPPGGAELEEDARFVITTRQVPGSTGRVSTTYRELARDVRPGDAVLLDDGRLRLRVMRAGDEDVETRVEVGGRLRSRKGVNLPGVALSGPSFTGKDRKDLAAAAAAGVDYIAVSFIRSARDVVRVKTLLRELDHPHLPVIAKIERPEAVREPRLASSASRDGVMVARGDLGVETSAERVPIIQKQVLKEANSRGRIAITATQMLDSMTLNPMPTRAEASDVANAILDGSDAVMLSGETAVGKYPTKSVRTIERLVSYTERHADFADQPRFRVLIDRRRVEHAVSAAAREAAVAVDAVCIVAFTESGATVRHVSRMRPPCGILGFATTEPVYRRLALRYGVPAAAQPQVFHHGRDAGVGSRAGAGRRVRRFGRPGGAGLRHHPAQRRHEHDEDRDRLRGAGSRPARASRPAAGLVASGPAENAVATPGIDGAGGPLLAFPGFGRRAT